MRSVRLVQKIVMEVFQAVVDAFENGALAAVLHALDQSQVISYRALIGTSKSPLTIKQRHFFRGRHLADSGYEFAQALRVVRDAVVALSTGVEVDALAATGDLK